MDGQSQKLISKVQYKEFERGEFTSRQERTEEETIAIIEQFPWVRLRDDLVVSLTGPSVTIEGPNTDFLKLALYYEGKFALYYLDNRKHLFTRSLARYEDAYPYIHSFFAAAFPATPAAKPTPFEPRGMNKETTWMLSIYPHFANGTFHYTISYAKLLWRTIPTVLLTLFALFADIFAIFDVPEHHPAFFFGTVTFGLAAGVTFLYLLLNHYRSAHRQVLIMTKGADTFYYGPAEEPEMFDKKNIAEIITHGQKDPGRVYHGALVRIEIQLTNGRSLNISSLLIDQPLLVDKCPGCPLRDEKKWVPLIPPSSSTPS